MADNLFTFTGRGGGPQTLDTSTGVQGMGGDTWTIAPGGVYTKTDKKGKNVWIDPRTKTATDAPMEGYYTGLGGGQFYTDPDTGFRLSQTGDIWSGKYGTQRVVGADGDSPYKTVLHPGDFEGVKGDIYIDESGVMRRGKAPAWEGGLIDGVAAPVDTSNVTSGSDLTVSAKEGVTGLEPIDPTTSTFLSDPIQDRLTELTGETPEAYETASVAEMTPEQDVVWQLDRILAEDNPLITRAMESARAKAYDEANARGLLNTSMAIEAAEGAALDAAYSVALPLAESAAAAEQDIVAANLASESAFQQLGIQLRSDEALQNSSLASAEILQTLANDNAITVAEIDSLTKLAGIELENDAELYMHEITEDNKLALQTNASVSTAYSNTVASIGQVYSNPEMSATQQNEAAGWYMDQFEGYVEFQDTVNETNYAESMDWGDAGTRTQVADLQAQVDQLEQQGPGGVPTRDGRYTYEKAVGSDGRTYRWSGSAWEATSLFDWD